MNAPTPRSAVRHHLQRLLGQARRRAAAQGLLAWFGAGGGLVLLAALALGAGEPGAAVRWSVTALLAAALAAGCVRLLWQPLRRLRSARDLAGGLEARGDHANALTAAEEALRRPDRWPADDPAGAELVRRLLARAADDLDRVDLARDWPLPHRAAARWLAGVVLVGAALTVAVMPQTLTRGLRALALPGVEPATAGRVGLFLAPGPDHVLAGEGAVLAALDFGPRGADVVCEVRVGSGLWRPLRAEPSAPQADDGGATFVRWQTALSDLREDVSYRFRRGARITETATIAVWHPPLLGDLAAVVRPPAYTRLPATTLARLPGLVEVPAGSRLDLSGRADAELATASLTTSAGDTQALAVRGREVSGGLEVTAPLRMAIRLTDGRGLTNGGSLVYDVSVVPDAAPVATLAREGDDGQLPLAAPLSLMLTARDDYGVASLDLLLRRSGDDAWHRTREGDDTSPLGAVRARIQRLAAGDALEARRLVTLDATALSLVPGDALELCAEAHDNREPGPAGVGRSAILRLTVPSSSDLLAEHAQEDATKQAELADSRRRSADLAQDLERLRRELLRNPVPDWNKQQELQAALQRQQSTQQQLSQLAEEMQRNLESLAANQLTSQELLAKMDEIAQLLKEATSPEVQAMLQKLQEAMGQLSPKDLAAAIQELSRDQQDMLRRMDTAMSMLQDLAREQELEGMTSMLAQMMREQQKLAEQAREKAGEKAKDNAGDQKEGDQKEDEQKQGEQKQGDQKEGGQKEGDQKEGDQKSGDQDRSSPRDDAKQGQKSESAEELARRQEALAQQMEQLQEQLEKALAELQERQEQSGESSPMAEQMKQALEQALEQMKQDQTAQSMKKAGEQMQQSQPSQASQQMQQSLAEMAGLYSVLLRTQASMQMAMQQTQAASLRDLASDLLALSQRQEQVNADIPMQMQDLRTESLARRQHQVVQSTIVVRDDLGKAASAAPQEILRLLNKVDDLLETQGRAMHDLESGNGAAARSTTRESLAEMNRVVIGLLTQAQMSSSGGGSGSQSMPQLGQQLRQMTQEQAALNALAERLQRQQGLSEQMRAEMQRLQQGQRGLSGRARELAEQEQRVEQTDGPRILGDLRDLAREMERVADDLGGGAVSEETLQRQERILSRLLDAHNSARERDFAKRRESRTADEVFATQPGDDGVDDPDAENRARRQQTVEKAPPAYRELVRRYFRDLLELERQEQDDGASLPPPAGDLP